MRKSIVTITVLVASLGHEAQAGFSTDAGDIRTFNLVVVNGLNNTTGTPLSVEGMALVGGTVGSVNAGIPGAINTIFGTHLNSSFNAAGTLTVGGDVDNPNRMTFGNLRVNSGASILSPQSFTNGGTIDKSLNSSSSVLSGQISSALTSASSNLQGLANTTNAQTISNPLSLGSVTMDASKVDGNGVSVFNISGSLLHGSNIQSLNLINSVGASAIVINVSGVSVNDTTLLTGDFVVSSATSQVNTKIIWNFYQATSLQGTQSLDGAVLAATADLHNFTAVINGAVFVDQYEPSADIHLPYQSPGMLPTTLLYSGPGFVSTVPEPATVVSTLSGLAIVGLAAFRRHRRRLAS